MKHDIPGSMEEITEQCQLLGVSVNEEFHGKIRCFLDLLQDCSRRVNLIGPGERSRLWGRHVLESVAFAGFLKEHSVVDVGAGAGFPGFILAILGYDVTMVEPRGKRCAFLEVASRECGVRCTILNSRIETAGPFPSSTQFTARAVKEPDQLIRMIAPAASGDFSLYTRVPDNSFRSSSCFQVSSLPVPPLDRPGFMLQYSHS